MRFDKRQDDQLREIKIIKDFLGNATGSCLIECGNTRVICTAMIEEEVPSFLIGKGSGWVTAEYAMLPASTLRRKKRDMIKPDGRSVEIQRLIGRSLRSVCDLAALGERTIYIDCDVIQADGGTRTASITGAFIALAMALDKLMNQGIIARPVLKGYVGAVSVGIVENKPLLDLPYAEDSAAQADMNVVMTDSGGLIEVQMTGEKRPVTEEEFACLISLAKKGISELIELQRNALGRVNSIC